MLRVMSVTRVIRVIRVVYCFPHSNFSMFALELTYMHRCTGKLRYHRKNKAKCRRIWRKMKGRHIKNTGRTRRKTAKSQGNVEEQRKHREM
jgi:hypothetical protein